MMHTNASSSSPAPHTAAQLTDFTQPAAGLYAPRTAGQLHSIGGQFSLSNVPPACANPAYSIWNSAQGSGGGGIAGVGSALAPMPPLACSPGPIAFPPQATKLSA